MPPAETRGRAAPTPISAPTSLALHENPGRGSQDPSAALVSLFSYKRVAQPLRTAPSFQFSFQPIWNGLHPLVPPTPQKHPPNPPEFIHPRVKRTPLALFSPRRPFSSLLFKKNRSLHTTGLPFSSQITSPNLKKKKNPNPTPTQGYRAGEGND